MKIAAVLVGALLVLGVHGVPSTEQVQSAIHRAQQINTLKRGLDALYATEDTNSSPAKRCPLAMFHGKRSSANSEKDRKANEAITAAQLLLKAGHSVRDLQDPAVTAEFERNLVKCDQPIVACDAGSVYRTADGTCNNLQNAAWGMAGSTQRREIASVYADGISNPRSVGVNGGALPNVRQISNAVHASERGTQEIRSTTINLHAFQMGQFLDHDIIATPTSSEVTDCCSSQSDINNCLPIVIEGGRDPTFRNFDDGYCMNFVRSAPTFCPNASGQREQSNDITSWIDASNVYGTSDTEMAALRDGAFLKTETGNRLPNNPDQTHCNANNANGEFCSLAGDSRVNVVPSLTAYHTLFVREHNRIATELRASITDDETLFQETRKLIIAIMQKIVFDEFLPSFMSPDAVAKYKFASSETYTYNDALDATIDNAFGIAYRVGHSWIPRRMDIFDRNLRPFIRTPTEETYNDPALTYVTGDPAGLEGLAYWLTGDNSPETDAIVEDAARNRLFTDGTNSFDIVALNIQRGRDHGLPSYNEFRKFCGLSDATVWTQGEGGLVDHALQSIADLDSVYDSPEDIDLFTGAITERHVTGGSLGPTLECLLGDQFNRLKYGDRFWYQGQAAGLTPAQQSAVQAYSMAAVLCVNYNFDRINAPNAFRADDPRTRCRDISGLDLTSFKPTTTAAPTTAAPVTTAPPTAAPTTRPPRGGDRRPPPRGGNPRPRTLDVLLEELITELEEENKIDNSQ